MFAYPVLDIVSNTPKVSIIIPNFNGMEYLHTCLSSLQKQTFKDFEVIVVDNNSHDSSEEFIKKNYPAVRVIKNTRNHGYSTAVNQGIKLSNAEFIATLNNDASADPQWLDAIIRALKNNPDVNFCASKILNYSSRNIIESAGDEIMNNGFGRKRGYGEPDRGQFNYPEKVVSACGAAALYRRKMLDDIDLFDEDFFAYLEDVDLSFRAHLKGYQCLFVPDAVVYHREFGTTKHDKYLPIILSLRNSIMLVLKNFPMSLLIKKGMILNMLFAYSRVVLFLIIKGRSYDVLKSFQYIAKNFSTLLRKRKQNMKNCIVSYNYLNSIIAREEFTYKKIKTYLGKLL